MRKDNRITIRMTEDLWAEINRIAKEKKLSKSEVIKRVLIRELIDRI